MNSLSKAITSQDLFGYTISFNFQQKGDKHNTLIGGFCSILLKTIFIYFVVLNIKKLIYFEDNKVTSSIEAYDVVNM